MTGTVVNLLSWADELSSGFFRSGPALLSSTKILQIHNSDDRLHQQNRKIMNPEAAQNRHESAKNNDLPVSDDCFSQITKNEKANHLEYLKNFR